MKIAWMIVDGYSLYHREPALKKYLNQQLEVGREHLIRLIEGVTPTLAERTTIVFDGRGEALQKDIPSPLVEVIFAPTHRTADTVIERMVATCSKPQNITVVTNDYAERDQVSACGAMVMSCGQFLDLFSKQTRRQTQRQKTQAKSNTGFTLGDLFP